MNSWIEWKGGERPVSPDEMVDIKLRAGQIYLNRRGDSNWWNNKGRSNDIIAYRLHQPEPQYCESVTRTIPDQPTIESLAADYRAKLAAVEIAENEAAYALGRLERAGEALGLLISPVRNESL